MHNNSPFLCSRNLDKDEMDAITFTMETIYQCSMAEKWPLTFLLHHFVLRDRKYSRCLEKIPSPDPVKSNFYSKCLKHLTGVCRGNFYGGYDKMMKCKHAMWLNGHYVTPKEFEDHHHKVIAAKFTEEEVDKFRTFFSCLRKVEVPVRNCAQEWLDKPCLAANVRIIKTVRSPMDVPRYFLSEYPNFKLVHLFRDPRGVVNSRFTTGWAQSKHEGKKIQVIAHNYCQDVISDYWLRKSLELKYPKKILEIISDDFMLRPQIYVGNITELIGFNQKKISQLLSEKLRKAGIIGEASNTGSKTESEVVSDLGKTNSTDEKLTPSESRKLKGESRTRKWEKMLEPKQVKEIESICSTFYQNIKFDW